MRISDWSSDVCSSDLPLSRRWRLPISPYQIFLCEWRHWMIVEGLSRRLREPCVALETSTYLPAGRGRMTSRGPDAAAERAKQIVVTMGFALPSESANRAFSGVGRRKMPSKFGFPRFTVLRLSHYRITIWGSFTLILLEGRGRREK